MKKLNYLIALLALVAVTLFTACEKNEIQNGKENIKNLTFNNNHSVFKISKEEALKELINTLNLISEKENWRSSSFGNRIKQIENMDIDDILTVQDVRSKLTRSTETANQEEMMYLVNFENNGGYAVLSADRRIPESVLAIVEEGNISVKDFDEGGFFMTEKERQEEIENFKYFNEEEQDLYVGQAIENQKYPSQYLKSYACESIDKYPEEEQYPSSYIRRGTWNIKEEVSALLDTKWHQRTPFNDMCPERRKYLRILGPKRKALAGCVPVAVAQIMAYHQYPTSFTYNGIYVNWKEVKNVWNCRTLNSGNAIENLMAAALLKGIGDWTNILYGYSGSMGLPGKARKYLEYCGYSNVKKYSGKNTDKTMEMLRKKKPVFMAGASGIGGHAWVVDGFRIKTRNIETINGATGNVISKSVEEETLLHCNWGWGGTADGYYAAGVFNTKKGASEYDNKDWSRNNGGENYNWLFSIITYDK